MTGGRTAVRAAALLVALAAVGGSALPSASAAAPGAPVVGGYGVGDPLYPYLGNGGYAVRHYDVDFAYDPATRGFTGSNTVSATATEALSGLSLDMDGQAIASVTVDGAPAGFTVSRVTTGQKLNIVPARPIAAHRRFTVKVAFSGSGNGPFTSLSGWSKQSDGGFVSAVQATRADTFLPVDDTPSSKPTWTFHLTAPNGWTASANGDALGRRPAGDDRTTWDFAMRSPMPSELMGISVEHQTEIDATGPHGLRLRSYVPSDQTAQYAPIVAKTSDQIAWLERKLDARFPFGTYGVQIVRDGYADGLENATLSLFGPNWFGSAATSESYQNVMVHELTHQWFGDSVTPHDWQQAWLNEGPAMFYQYTWAEEHGGASLESVMKAKYQQLDAVRKTDGPPGRPTGLGGFNIYDGAAVVLYALQQQVGDAAFARIMHSWVTTHRNAWGSSDLFIDTAVRSTGDSSLRPFLEAWLFSPDNPPMPGHPDWSTAP
ncbi:hypothetical protein BIV57_07850 [Mangrovactinospora gilvigrisea]|uniref:Aminopeptidase N n=1 Tax=Mangrovactinospora gilvigrisea TaxID=1428644 RepID=A0A1J7BX36_9ACTN|nr:M1 family metallopeptidase [Mangrovactinospora gilvigrisea]OIV38041.1 hypothetical protein BIV57_07850 [Mangrovactinospora gilvigrisea]